MADRAMDTYLNDHLAGAVFGRDLAARLRARSRDTALAGAMEGLAREIEEDRQTLVDLMERMGTTRNPAKQAGTWVAEKASRVKFGSLTAGEPRLGGFMALETLSLGVAGKRALWSALREVADEHPPVRALDLDRLIARADAQRELLERERVRAARAALRNDAS